MDAMRRRTLSGWKLGAVTLGLCAVMTLPVDAQDTAVTTTTTHETEERDSGFPWGLLGLLGLAGLLGRGRKEEVHTHRETVRPVETHRPATGGTTTGTVDRTVIRPDDTPGTGGGTTGGGTRL
jgi:MYXO-CTERM domain-containing protein